MNLFGLAIFLGSAIAAYAAIRMLDRWRSGFLARRLVRQVVPGAHEARTSHRDLLHPERRFLVEISESRVTCSRPDGAVESVAWDDLESVELVSDDTGPRTTDVFWVLHGRSTGCAIPQGATGEMDLVERLQALPGFDNEAVIRAMSSSRKERRLCWEHPDRGAPDGQPARRAA